MPYTLSAKKRVRQSRKRHQRNMRVKSMIKTYTKKFEECIKRKDFDEAKRIHSLLVPIIDRAATKGIIHINKAARKKSALSRKLLQAHSYKE